MNIHSPNEETEAQRGEVTFPRPHSRLRPDPDSLVPVPALALQRAAPGSKAVASLLLLWEGTRCDGTGKMGEGFGKD